MNNPQYHPLYQQARDLQYKFHDITSGSNHPAANVIRNEIHRLVEDIEVQKNPRTLEDRIKVIQRQLKEAERQNVHPLTYEHMDDMHDRYEHMRMNLRKFDNY